ncbi:hypothetical protein [Aquimarina longa]|uniref:hypothetical protein n=1 Tax=Aquimarina longa TaxID=1080221 RepID=UPI000786520D|nr:hypothetical protein [Aquimarina longa]
MQIKFFYIAVLFLLFTIPMEAQCAMCRAVLESEEGQKTAKGINNGIIYLMIIPYVLIGVVGYFVYRNKKKTKTS